MVVPTLLAAAILASVTAAPPVSYDQRQEGRLNVHAQLENVVVLLIPPGRLQLPQDSPWMQALSKSTQHTTKGTPGQSGIVLLSDSLPLTIVSKDALNQKSPAYPGLKDVTPPPEFEAPPAPGESPSSALLQALAVSKTDAVETLPTSQEEADSAAEKNSTTPAAPAPTPAEDKETPEPTPPSKVTTASSKPPQTTAAAPKPKPLKEVLTKIDPGASKPSSLVPNPPKNAPVPATVSKVTKDEVANLAISRKYFPQPQMAKV